MKNKIIQKINMWVLLDDNKKISPHIDGGAYEGFYLTKKSLVKSYGFDLNALEIKNIRKGQILIFEI